MASKLTSLHIIGDENLADYLELNSDPNFDFIGLFRPEHVLNKKYIFVVMFFGSQVHIILNTGVECFSNSLITKDESILLENEENVEFQKKLCKSNFSNLEYLNYCIFSGFMTTIMLRQKNGRYFVVDKDPSIRVVVPQEAKEQYDSLPIFQVKPNCNQNFDLIYPYVYYPRIFCMMEPQLAKKFNSYRETKKMFYEVFLKILECAECPENADDFGKNWVIMNICGFSKDNIRGNLTNYRDWYEEMLSIYKSLKNNKSKADYFFFENSILFQNGHPDYSLIEKDILCRKSLISFCNNMNHPEFTDYRVWPTIFAIVPNTLFKHSKKTRELTLTTRQISEEEAKRNADLLLEEEEKEIEKKRELDSKKSKKKKESLGFQNGNKKVLAKKIAYEAKDYFVKMEIQRRKRIKLEKQHRILALKLAEEAIQYLTDKSSTPTIQEVLSSNDDNSHCYLGSEEHYRRLKTWDLTQIIPEIYCLPKEFLISLFSQKQSDALWLFNLENVN